MANLATIYSEARKSLVDFYRVMLAGDEYVPPAKFHYDLSDILLNNDKHFAIEAFRESAKSSYVLQAYPLYLLTYPQEEKSFVVIIKSTQTLADKTMKEIQNTYLSHPILKGNVIKVNEQSASKFEVVVMGVGMKPVTMRFEAYGKGSSLRGLNWGTKRPQVVICDDLQDMEDSYSDVVQIKDWDWFLADVKPLGKNTRIFMIGNNLGEKCIIERLFQQHELLGFDVMKIAAIDEEGNATWPEQFTVDELYKEKAQYVATGKIDIWYRERMCVAMPEENRIFKKEYIHYFDNDDLKGKNLQYFIAVDPAISQKKSADNTAICVVGKEPTSSKWYVVELIAKKMNPSEIIEALFMLYDKYRPVKIGIEVVAYQQALSHFFHEEMSRRGVYPVVQELRHSTKKEERIMGLQPMFRCGDVLIRNSDIILEEELLAFPKGAHDDTCFVAGTQIATDKGYKNIENIQVGDKVLTPFGFSKVRESECTGERDVGEYYGNICTHNHKFFSFKNGFKAIDSFTMNDRISTLSFKDLYLWSILKKLYSKEQHLDLWDRESITYLSQQQMLEERIQQGYMLLFGKIIMERLLKKDIVFIILMATTLITVLKTLSVLKIQSIKACMRKSYGRTKIIVRKCLSTLMELGTKQKNGTLVKKEENGMQSIIKTHLENLKNISIFVCSVIKNMKALVLRRLSSVPIHVCKRNTTEIRKVYNITVDAGMYYANGVLVSNCDALSMCKEVITTTDFNNTDAQLEKEYLDYLRD